MPFFALCVFILLGLLTDGWEAPNVLVSHGEVILMLVLPLFSPAGGHHFYHFKCFLSL